MASRTAVLLAVGLAVGCGGGDQAARPVLELSFPGAVDGVVPFTAGAAMEVDVRVSVPGLCALARAEVEIIEPLAAGAAPVVVTLRPVDGCVLEGRASLAWPSTGEATVRAAMGGQAVVGTVRRAPATPLELSLASVPSTVSAAGGILQLTVTATLAGLPAKGVTVALETLGTGVTLLPASFVSDDQGQGTASVLLAPGAREVRIDAVSGGTRRGITLVLVP